MNVTVTLDLEDACFIISGLKDLADQYDRKRKRKYAVLAYRNREVAYKLEQLLARA